jgi:hypothetical protein
MKTILELNRPAKIRKPREVTIAELRAPARRRARIFYGRSRVTEMVGRRFGRRVVLAHAYTDKNSYWLVHCDCGTEQIACLPNLKKSASCGCIHAYVVETHGHSKNGKSSKIYCVWDAMRQRCFNPNTKGFKHYGGKGITVCDRWLVFKNFLADMGEAPAGLSLDRIDNNGNYEPSNCRWATRLVQNQNKRQRGPAHVAS